MNLVVRFLMFWYDFLIGDCWEIAAGVVIALGLAAVVVGVQPDLAEPFSPVLALMVAGLVAGTVWLAWRQKASG